MSHEANYRTAPATPGLLMSDKAVYRTAPATPGLITSLLRRLQGRPSPAEAPPIDKTHPFSKIAVTFEPLRGFGCPS